MERTRENTDIISVHVTPARIFISYAIFDNNVLTNHKVEHQVKQKPMHADFRVAIENMKLHLHGAFQFPDSAEDRVSVSGIEIQSKDNQDSVKIFGKLCLQSGNLTVIKTDYIRYESDNQPYKYEGVEEIGIDANIVREEAFRYLFEDKQAQLQLDFKEEENEDDVQF